MIETVTERPVLDDGMYLRAIELATGLRFKEDPRYLPNGTAEMVVALKSYHQDTDPYAVTLRSLCYMFLNMRMKDTK